ncbi:MAG: DUF362 domain-containing protein [Kiritimatiellaeota bacterium]|nr:DUF362 domain-containing protein [Kiritimatiellota bacterium]
MSDTANVYFTDFRATYSENLLQKLQRLIKAAGMGGLPFEGKYTAIKIHFGEPGNLAFLRPNYAKAVVDFITAHGGKAFLTDCNTLYVGGRKNALDHLDAAYANGFTPFSTGCHVLIGDGLKGVDDVNVPLPDGHHVKEAKIGRAIMDADIFVSLNHFKGHEMTGFGGALKNIGMGCGSRAGKMEMHAAGKPKVNAAACIGCGVCVKCCAHGAVAVGQPAAKAAVTKRVAHIDPAVCAGCGRCMGHCPKDAIRPGYDESIEIMNAKMAEYTAAVLRGRPHFHISLICDVSPECDCHDMNDAPVIPNLGMLASADPVALDQACADLCCAAAPLPGTMLTESAPHKDHFCALHPNTNWRTAIAHAERMNIGTSKYTLVRC